MKLINFARSAILAAGVIALSHGAQAATYSNLDLATQTIYTLGYPDTTTYGQTFTGVSGVLDSFSFYASSGNAGNIDLVITAWDGSKAVGPVLYDSGAFSYSGGSATLGASGINLSVTADTQYVAYLTTAGVSTPLTSVTVFGSASNDGLAGSFVYLNSNNVDPLVSGATWTTDYSVKNMAYTATFNSAVTAVPEPTTYAMLLAGLGFIAFTARRKSAVSRAV